MLMRPPSRPFIAMAKPSPSSPRRCVSGTSTSSKLIARVGWLFQPIFCSFLPNCTPGVCAGTAKAEMPPGPAPPVRAITTSRSVSPAPEMKALLPLST